MISNGLNFSYISPSLIFMEVMEGVEYKLPASYKCLSC